MERGSGWGKKALDMEYKGYYGVIRTTLLRPSTE